MNSLYWTKERCIKEGLKYKTKKEFRNCCNVGYHTSCKNDWLNEVCSHMIQNNKWTFDKCVEEALKYNSKVDFENNCPSAINASRKNGWLDEICSHMKVIGNKYKRCIYSFEFSDNSVYVGLTYNIDKRIEQHLTSTKSSVYKHINNGLTYEIKKLSEYINIEDSIKMESYFVEKYRDNGWIILNKIKTGSLGGDTLIWTIEKCVEIVKKYKSRKDFKKDNKKLYNLVCSKGWLDIVCENMISSQKPKNYWTKEKCFEITKRYKNKNELRKNEQVVYEKMLKKNWLYEIYSKNTNNKNYWTKEKCFEVAKIYNSIKDFITNDYVAYCKCLNNKWLDDACIHMMNRIKKNEKGYWTKERCIEEGLKYNSKKDFREQSKSCYSTCIRNKWIDDIIFKKLLFILQI